MNWKEFQSYTEGFFGDIDDPTQNQLDRLRRMLGEVDLAAKSMSDADFFDKYWAPYATVLEDGLPVARPLPFKKWDSAKAFSHLGHLDATTIT
jgi:hypothetical protein